MTDDGSRSRVARWRGLVGLAAQRTVTRAVRTERHQTTLSVVGVAVSIGLMLVVTSVGVGLAQSATVGGNDVDYTIVPEGASSTVMGVEGARLGRVHRVSERLNAREDVTYATPVRTTLVRVQTSDGDPANVLMIGIIPSVSRDTLVGLPTTPLTPGDPYFGNGSYDGTWTGEAVLSTAAADALNATRGDRLVLAQTSQARHSFTVVNVSDARSAGIGQFPVLIVHLSELQAVTGGTASDAADQIVVDTSADLEDELAIIYPRSRVLSRGDLFGGGSTTASQLPIAISVAAFIVAVVIGTLFTMTTMGFELASESHERAVMAAIGVSRMSRTVLVVLEALTVVVLGGLAGIVFWLIGIAVTNAVATIYLTDVTVAVFRPVFAAYGLGVAVLIGLLTLPYLLVLSQRTVSTETLLG